MKKLMMIGSALLVLSSSAAFASQARLLALGMNETDNEGMYYISDSRNIFLNPAYINVYSNLAEFEWGSAGQIATASAATTLPAATLNNNTSAPKAQGGVFKKYGDFVYGLYFGNESNTSSLLRVAGTAAGSALNGFTGAPGSGDSKMLQTADNQVDLFFGGDNGIKWAVNPTIAIGKNEARSSKDSAAAVRMGIIATNWDAHLNVSLASKSNSTDAVTVGAVGLADTIAQDFKGKLGYHVGGSYILKGANRVFGYVKHYGWEQTDRHLYTTTESNNIGGQQGMVKGDFTNYYLGWGSEMEVNKGDKLFASLAAKKTDINLNFANKSEVRHLIIPLTLGYEAQATEWLILRGSVVQNLWGKSDNKNISNYGATGTRLNKVASGLVSKLYGNTGKTTIANSTAVNAGATLVFGQLSIDGLIGTTNSNGASVVSATNSNAPKTGILSLSNLETSVAATYKF
ncbi:MAG: hypothetical protein H7281_12280 [Bacteriovorax sp.]|nr:hypothetical protein [Bacteriovorax sp.]